MYTLIRFLRDDDGQDFAEYALLLGAIAVVATAVIATFRTQLQTTFNVAIAALKAAGGK